MKKRIGMANREPTRIIWSNKYESYICKKCNAVIQYNFRFAVCPYCARRVIHTDERNIIYSQGYGQWR